MNSGCIGKRVKEERGYNLEMYHLLLQMLKYMTVSLETSIREKQLYVQSGKVEVDYISTHTNHELGIQECANLPLPKSLHKSVKEKYSQGISIERIMEGKSDFQCSIHACMSIIIT